MKAIKNILKFFGIHPRVIKRKKPTLQKLHKVVVMHQGDHYDLKVLYDQVNSEYFEGQLDLQISWVGNKLSKPRRRVMFGSFNADKKLIKIHRRLDQAHIPSYFITYVIYHEMLHHVLPPIKKRGQKRRIHHGAFIEKEQEFQEYALAQSFSLEMRDSFFRKEI